MRKNRSLLLILIVMAVLTVLAYWKPAVVKETLTTWEVPAEEGAITASFTDDGNHGYILSLEGSGRIRDFASSKDAPWYASSGRVTKINLSEGITAIGDNAFPECRYVKSVIIPTAIQQIGTNAFADSTKLCAYGNVSANDERRIYQYSEGKPVHGGYYWHLADGQEVLWDVTRVLFIGNSFTYTFDIDQLFDKVATAAGASVLVERITIGAHNVSQFADPADEGGAMVEAALTASSDYDIIVIQEQSTRPLTNFDLFLEGTAKLTRRIHDTQDHCTIYLYSTWGYPKQTAVSGQTIPQMEADLRAAYAAVGKELGVDISPVGAAFSKTYTEHPEINLYSGDEQHPSYAGAYLSACVHVGKLLGIDPRSSAFDGYPLPENPRAEDPVYANDTEFSKEISEILRQAAYSTVFESK